MNDVSNNDLPTLEAYEAIIDLPVNSLNEEQKNTLSVYLIYTILMEKLPLEKINTYPNDIIERVNCILNNDSNSTYYIPLQNKLGDLLANLAIENSSNFSLEEFLKKDIHKPFPYECKYNESIPPNKAALGLIFPKSTFYCDVPNVILHEDVALRYFLKYDPDFERKLRYAADWHSKLMQEKKVIIIHFSSNVCGEAIYIPDEITEFQYNELKKINELLQKYNINGDTGYNVPLNILINDDEFQYMVIRCDENTKK